MGVTDASKLPDLAFLPDSGDTHSHRPRRVNSMCGMAGINEQLLDNLKRMGVPMAYGDKVELGNAEVIPVALATFGFGSGEGEGDFTNGKPKFSGGSGESGEGGENDKRRGGTGAGMGGGGASIPIGAYVSDEFGTRFQPNLIATLIAVLPVVLVAAWGLPRLVKALKR